MEERMVYKKGGLINFYKFYNETFYFDKKFTIINGENSTGKTTSMVSLMPNLLTLKENDSMGIRNDKSKRFDFYLKNDSTSYIWASIENSKKVQVLIIAYDKSPKDNSITKTGFIIKENKSIKDVHFYDENNNLYQKSEFKRRNKEIIDLATSFPNEYKKEINNRLFGFDDMKYYENYMDLIVNLTKATTKSNTKLTIDEIKESLMNSLIDPRENINEPLNVFVRGIENEYEAKKELDIVNNNINLIQIIDKNIKDLNTIPYVEIIKKSKKIDDICRNLYDELNNLKNKLSVTNKEFKNINTLIEDIKEKQNNYKIELDLIDVSDYEGLSLRIKQIENELNELNNDVNKQKEKLNKQENDYNIFLEKTEKINVEKSKINETIKDLKLKNNLLKNDLRFDVIKNNIKAQENIINKRNFIKEKIEKINIINKNENQNLENNIDDKNKLNLKKDELTKEYLILFNKWIENYALNLQTITDIELLINNNNYEEEFQETFNSFEKKILQLENKKQAIKNEIILINKKIQLLKNNKKPITPNEFSGGKELFELVDFKKTTDNNIKLEIEAGLKESKLMYTIFNPNDVLHGIVYKDIEEHKNEKNSLLNYLNIITNDKNIYDKVKAFLSHIFIDLNTRQLYTKNAKYIALKEDKITYIGEDNRRKERELQIKTLQENCALKDAECKNIGSKINNLMEERDKFYNDYKKLLNPNAYMSIIKEMENKEEEINKRKLIIQNNNKTLQEYEEKSNELYYSLINDLPSDKDELYKLERELNNFKEAVIIYNNIEEQLNLYKNTISNNKENIADLKINIKNINTKIKAYNQEKNNIEKKLTNTKITDKINKKNQLENKIKELNNELNKEIFKKGGISNSKEELEKEIKIIEQKYNIYIANKKIKDEILQEYNIENVEKQKNIDKNKCLNIINEKKSILNNLNDAIYKVDVFYCNSPDIKLEKICNELEFISSQIKNIYKLKYINSEQIEENEETAINVLKDKLDICNKLYNKKASDAYIRLFGEELLGPIKKSMIDSENIAKVIEDKLENQKQEGITSYFLKYKEKDVDSKDKVVLNIIKGKIDYNNDKVHSFFNNLTKKIYDAIEENKNRNEIIEDLYNEINYKNYFSFKIMVLKKDEDKKQDLTTKVLSGLSSGELYRAFLELAIIQIEAARYRAKKSNTMPLFAQIDEIGNNLDPIQIARIENILANSFTNIIATSPDKYYVGSQHDACYIRLVELNSDYVMQESKVLDETIKIQPSLFD